MPIRVRCRCGQELVLRHSEWIYLCLGIVILALVVNSVALVLIYLRLDALRGGAGGPAAGTPPAAAAEPRAVPAPAATEPAATEPAVKKPVSLERPKEPARPATVAVRPGAATGDDPIRDLLESQRAKLPPPPAPVAPRVVEPQPAAVEVEGPWSRESPLVRFLLLESQASPLGPYAALLDADAALRDHAIVRLSRPGALAAPPPGGRALATAAARQSLAPARLEQLLASLAPASGAEPAPSEALGSWWRQCAGRLEENGWRAAREACAEAGVRGIDIVLLVDVTQSMEGLLASLRRHAGWLLSAWTWGLPQARIGAVFYRDGVEAVQDLTSHPLDELLPRLEAARAEGGGDVPEGVHAAVEAALSLGTVRWRQGALKHLVLVGDAPPPHRESAQLLKLMLLAHRQGGYRLHALIPAPADGEPAATFLIDLARAAGGTGATLSHADEIGGAAFAAVFPSSAAALVRPLAPNLRDLFAQSAR